ncbi:MAG: hypothetical protein IJ460_03115 [Clostridia bacterium]|nr:hypothetical protein [Clostridia bacterium]
MKKLIVTFICLIFWSLTAHASDTVAVNSALKLEIDLYDNKAQSDTISLMSTDIEQVFHNAVKEHQLMFIQLADGSIFTTIRIDLSEFNLDVSTDEKYNTVATHIYNLAYQSLEYFYLDGTVYPYVDDNAVMTDIFFEVRTVFTGDGSLNEQQQTLNSYIEKYDNECKKILADTLYPGMTEVEISLALHSYLGDTLYYDTDMEDLSFTSYSAILGEKAVCQGYSFAYEHLLRLVGIPGELATSSSMNHAWNVVYIDGSWYNIDTTWDDKEGYGVTHRYFMLSDETLTERGHHDWTATVTCTDKKFETGYFFNPIHTDSLYSSDFMTCRYTDSGYFLYKRSGKYYKSSINGTTKIISEAKYNADKTSPAKLSAPFICSGESFVFASKDDGKAEMVLINRSEAGVDGTVFAAYYAGSGLKPGNISSIKKDVSVAAGEYIFIPLTLNISSKGADSMVTFFWNDSLTPYAKSICVK